MNRTGALVALVIIQAGIIGLLVASKTQIQIKPTLTPVMAVQSPLELALEYELPDGKFEKLVKENAAWIPFRSPGSGSTILADCALLKKSNHVRILIAHGANIDDAIESLKNVSADDAIELLRQIANRK